jgi:hypothetical protein
MTITIIETNELFRKSIVPLETTGNKYAIMYANVSLSVDVMAMMCIGSFAAWGAIL